MYRNVGAVVSGSGCEVVPILTEKVTGAERWWRNSSALKRRR